MPDIRTSKSISQRFDVEFNRHPESALRRWRRIVTWACAAIPLVLIGLYEIVGDGSIYWAAPLTPKKHQPKFEEARANGENGCKLCHTKMGQPLWRLVTASNLPCSVADESCQKCHPANARLGHSPLMAEGDVRGCAVCHEEHRGKKNLTEVADMRCVECHANLRTNNDQHNFFTHVKSFAAHPEFAASRFRGGSAPAADAPPGPEHGVKSRTTGAEGKLLDRTPLHFNHEAHLQVSGVLMLEPDAAGQLDWHSLQCIDCHQTSPDGRFMQPINYQKHCSTCHPLSFSEQFRSGDQKTLPHEPLSKVYLVAQTRLREYLKRTQKSTDTPDATPPEYPRLPFKRGVQEQNLSPEQQFQESWAAARDLITGGCAHCHLFTADDLGGEAALQVVPPHIPDRWLPHGRFRHDRHEGFACVACHDPAALDENIKFEANPHDERQRLLKSRDTSDILLPSVAVCQKCHVEGSRAAWTRASAECIKCHAYHPKSKAR